MADETFPYDEWVEEALVGVLRRALTEAARHGLPGEHHFYINFRTSHPDVSIPSFLRAQYPEEVTIVLQHQFEDLVVGEDGFDVTLSFNGKRHALHMPFAAITSFADPSVNFGLQVGLEHVQREAPDALPEAVPEPLEEQTDAAAPESKPEPEGPVSAEVIALDAFRKS
jgi:hypothetical protein